MTDLCLIENCTLCQMFIYSSTLKQEQMNHRSVTETLCALQCFLTFSCSGTIKDIARFFWIKPASTSMLYRGFIFLTSNLTPQTSVPFQVGLYTAIPILAKSFSQKRPHTISVTFLWFISSCFKRPCLLCSIRKLLSQLNMNTIHTCQS